MERSKSTQVETTIQGPPCAPPDLVHIRDSTDGIQWIGRRVDVWIEGCGTTLHRCFIDGIVAHCTGHEVPRLVVISSTPDSGQSAGTYGAPFTLYVREIGSVEFVLTDELPLTRPFRHP